MKIFGKELTQEELGRLMQEAREKKRNKEGKRISREMMGKAIGVDKHSIDPTGPGQCIEDHMKQRLTRKHSQVLTRDTLGGALERDQDIDLGHRGAPN